MEIKSGGLENLVDHLFLTYSNKNVFVTGHTGFKGSWLVAILKHLNANVHGYALPPETLPNHYSLLPKHYQSTNADILNLELLKGKMIEAQPEIIFHLAAQAYVLKSYEQPIRTYQTNVIGTLNVLEAARSCKSVRAIIIVTTDKVYENKEQDLPYNEADELGGFDMYSSSKACCEILVNSYRRSFFNLDQYKHAHHVLLATVRAGNVIGGGDWSSDRLIPDIVRATVNNKQVSIRHPNSIRPWQHVLDCLMGYLMLGQKLLSYQSEYSGSWNFSPVLNDSKSVVDILSYCKQLWPEVNFVIEGANESMHEAKILKLNHEKAKMELCWVPKLKTRAAVDMTIQWYKAYYFDHVIQTEQQIKLYFENEFIS